MLGPFNTIQKFTPSLAAPKGVLPDPVENVPIVVKSAAFQSETLFASGLVRHEHALSVERRDRRKFEPLPVSVARTAPLEARTTETEFDIWLGTQMLVPSKIGTEGCRRR